MKVLKAIFKIFAAVLAVVAVAILVFTIISTAVFDRPDRSIFGCKAFVVLSDSMSKTDFSAGDLVLVKETDPASLKEGDIIAYTSTNTENYGETVTHKIRSLTKDAKGEPGFITYGTTTDTDDEKVVLYPFVIGKYKGHVPKVGKFFQFLKTTPGYMLCIFLPFFMLILIQGINSIRLFRRYKAEQLAAVQQEKAAFEDEREKSRAMMEELARLKEQLGQNENSAQKAAPEDEAAAKAESAACNAAQGTVGEENTKQEDGGNAL